MLIGTRHLVSHRIFNNQQGECLSNLGRFLFDNFTQAINLRAEYLELLDKLPPDLFVLDSEVDALIDGEKSYLLSLKSEPPEEALCVDYVTQLILLTTAQ